MLSSLKSLWNEKTVALSRKGKTAEKRSGFKLSRMLFISNAKETCWKAPSGFPLRVTRSRVKELVPFRGQVLVNAVHERGARPERWLVPRWSSVLRICSTTTNRIQRLFSIATIFCRYVSENWKCVKTLRDFTTSMYGRYVGNGNLWESIRISVLYETLWNFVRYLDRYLV